MNEAVRAFIPIDYFYHQENGSKALALRATLRARGLTTIFLMIFFYYGYEATTPRPKKNPLSEWQGEGKRGQGESPCK